MFTKDIYTEPELIFVHAKYKNICFFVKKRKEITIIFKYRDKSALEYLVIKSHF